MGIIEEAGIVYRKNFPMEAWFERALFFSWYCSIRDCAFCFMSSQSAAEPKKMRRSTESLLAEAILCRVLGWKSCFLSGGINAFSPEDIKKLLPLLTMAYGDKLWLNIGPLSQKLLEEYKPYVHGVVGALETVNQLLHKRICPSKPVEPYLKMFGDAHKIGLANAMTFIVGVGETKNDLLLLLECIEKYNITKIHIYSLIPEKGTVFANKALPSPEEQAWWIAQVRIHFPEISIQCGIWKDRVQSLHLLLEAGANSFSKFPATRLFGSSVAKNVEEQVKKAGRRFRGTLTVLPVLDWKKEVTSLEIDEALKAKVIVKLMLYLKRMQFNAHNGHS